MNVLLVISGLTCQVVTGAFHFNICAFLESFCHDNVYGINLIM